MAGNEIGFEDTIVSDRDPIDRGITVVLPSHKSKETSICVEKATSDEKKEMDIVDFLVSVEMDYFIRGRMAEFLQGKTFFRGGWKAIRQIGYPQNRAMPARKEPMEQKALAQGR